MNCQNHPDSAAVAFCRACGKALCEACQRPAQGTVFCQEHVPAPQAAPGPAAPSPLAAGTGTSPGLAFVLGLIPGVGAIYNGQYAKGLVHVLVLGLLISIADSGAAGELGPLVGLFIALWFFYMAFEAYHTASRRQRGEAVDEFSSLFPRRPAGSGFPVGPVLLIALGVLFLLNTLGYMAFHHILRYWPVFLIALGGYMLYCRLAPKAAGEETTHERQ